MLLKWHEQLQSPTSSPLLILNWLCSGKKVGQLGRRVGVRGHEVGKIRQGCNGKVKDVVLERDGFQVRLN